MTRRIVWIDSAKFIGIFLVIFNHFNIDYGQDTFKLVIASFHMPLFFFLSGLTVKDQKITFKDFTRYIQSRFTRIMIPYYLWAFIFCGGVSLRNILLIGYASNKSLASSGSNAVLWFLPCLFLSSIMVRLLLSFVSRVGEKKNLKMGILVGLVFANFIVGGVLGLLLPMFENYDLPFSLNCAFIGNGFMLSGYLIKQLLQMHYSFEYSRYRLLSFITGIVSLVLLCILSFYNVKATDNFWGRVVMARSLFGNYILFICSGIIGSLSILMLTRVCFRKQNIICAIGAETLTILCIHSLLISWVEKVLYKIAINSWLMVFALIILSAAVLAFSYVVAILIGKIVPNLAGKR